MKSLTKCLVVLFIFLGISPQDTSASALYSNEPKLEMTVEVFHDFEFNKIENIKIFISHKEIAMDSDLEFRIYKKLFISELENLNYSIVDDINDADFIVNIDYGISEKIKFINYPVYRYIDLDENIIFHKKKGNFEFKIQTKNPRKRIIIGYKTRRDISYQRHLSMDIFLSDSSLKIYQGRVVSEGKINSLPYVMNGLIYGLFIDFPGNNSSINIYQITEDIYNPIAYQKKHNLKQSRLKNWM